MTNQDLQYEQEWSEQVKEEMNEFFDRRLEESNQHQDNYYRGKENGQG